MWQAMAAWLPKTASSATGLRLFAARKKFHRWSESLVRAALANLMQGRTVVVIAHRLGTIRRANRIAVLEDGRITAIGSHEELLTTSPTYQRLYQLQFMDVPESRALQQLEPDADPSQPQLLEPALSGEAEE